MDTLPHSQIKSTPPQKFFIPARARTVDIARLFDLVEESYGYEPGTLRARSNVPQIAQPRMIVAYLAVELGLSYSDCGRAMGRHHTSVLMSCQKISELRKSDPDLEAFLVDLHARIEAKRDSFFGATLHSYKRLTIKDYVRLKLEQKPKPVQSAKRRRKGLPDIASRSIAGMEELDALIVSGKGDQPRMSVEKLRSAR